MAAIATSSETRALAGKLVEFLETGAPPAGLFADDLFCDLTVPQWRLQADTRDGAVALRRAGHPGPSTVTRSRLDETGTGFVLEFEERWADEQGDWYAREVARADVADGRIAELSIYCTGDWDAARQAEHRAQVELIRP
ncbi:MAG TPA: hypothetical protein VHC67_11000 [Gaiellaceae bacterium]|jgi:hypothetical protein|nr:hypothetical protein [Gaiellaceae bacterium]